MPDPIPQAEPQFKAAEVLHYGGEATGGSLSPEMLAAKTKGAELRREKASRGNAKSTFEAFVNKPSEKNFTKQNKEDSSLKFGVGEAKKNASGAIEEPTSAEAKALYDEAQIEIKNVNSFVQYSEITTEAKKTGKSIATILGERATKHLEGPTSQAEFDTQREKALDYIINSEVIQKGLPEVAAIANPVDRRRLIEETLAVDPVLKAKIVEKMISIVERAKALPEAPVNKEVRDAEDNKKEAGAKITDNLDLLKNRLTELGTDSARADELGKDVEKFIKDGKSVDQVLSYLRTESLKKLGDIFAIEEYGNAINSIDKLEAKLGGYDTTTADETLVRNTRDKWEKTMEIINNFEGNPALLAKLKSYQEIVGAFTSQKDNSSSTIEGGMYLSPVANGIDQIIRAQKSIINADKVIKEKGDQSKKDQESWKSDRMVQESNLISEMKNILPSSVAEVLSERYDEMVGLEKQRMVKVAEDEGKKGNKAIENGIKAVEYVKEKRWIEYNPLTRKKEVHDYMLGSDVKYAAYAGEDGIKRLILRDSGLQVKDAAGNLIPIDWKNVNLNTLPDDVKKTLEGVYAGQNESYKKKLFGDFFLGKSLADRTIFGHPFGDLALKNHEYELLQAKFGEVFAQGINTKAEAKAVVDSLKGSGVKMSGGLLAIIAMLFGGVFGEIKKGFAG